jgi:hypothetical protein
MQTDEQKVEERDRHGIGLVLGPIVCLALVRACATRSAAVEEEPPSYTDSASHFARMTVEIAVVLFSWVFE